LTPSFAFPPYLLVVALGNGVGIKNLYFLSLLLGAAFFSYLLLRKHHLSPEASFGGAAAVLFCGGLNQNAGSFIGQTAAGLPAALLLTRVFLDRPTWRRAAGMAAGYAVLALASFPPLLIASFGLSAAYAGVQIAAERDGRAAVRYAVATVLAVGLVAFYYLPAFAVIAETPQAQSLYRDAADESLPWYSFSQLLSPVLFGGSKIWQQPPMRDPAHFAIPYVGAVALLLAGLAGPVGPRRTRRFFWFLAAAGAVIALKICGVEPVQSLGRLPGLRTVHFAVYYGIPLNLLLGLATALGLERLLAGRVSRLRTVAIAAGLAVVTAAMLWVAAFRATLADVRAEDWLDRWYLFVVLLTVALGGALTLAWQGARTSRRRLAFTAWLVGVLAVEGIFNNAYPRQSRWDVWRNPAPYARELMARRAAGRVYAWGAPVFYANAGSAFEVFQVDSLMTFNAPRMFELYRRYAAPYSYLFLREASELPPEAVLDAANVAVVATREERPRSAEAMLARGYREFYDDDFARLFERATEPRYYFSSDVRRLARGETLAAIATRRPREVLLEEDPGFAARPNDGHEPPVVVESFRRNRVVLRVQAPRPGLVYASESYFPGWRATVAGRPAPILVANHAFRAVPVPAGTTVVELSYFPPGLKSGLGVSALSGLAVALLALRRSRKGPATHPE
ncbi:MAG TPA: hypothetical protein DD490_34955, partial [Acidobacteria bacterium]|nr:hypothetical protein [Acidobacteriota bacterium]